MQSQRLGLVIGLSLISIHAFASTQAECHVRTKTQEIQYNYICCKGPTGSGNVWVLNKTKCGKPGFSNKCTVYTKLKSYKGSAQEQCSQMFPKKQGISDFRIVD